MADYFLALNTAATASPVTVAEVKANARIDGDDEDALVAAYIAAAVRSIEEMTGRALMAQTWDYKTYGLKGNRKIKLPKVPVSAISAVTYFDRDNAEQSLSAGNFLLYTADDKAIVQPSDGTDWPSTYDRPDAVKITFVAGYSSASDVPEGLRQAVILLATHWFEHRAPVGDGKAMPIPFAIEHLVGLDRVGWVAA